MTHAMEPGRCRDILARLLDDEISQLAELATQLDHEHGFLVENDIDIVFANQHEATALFETGDDLDAALDHLRRRCKVAVVTLSEQGALVVAGDRTVRVPAEPIDRLVDTTGAGDLFAAGYLHGHTTGRDLADCLRFGAVAAAEVIAHVGARPAVSLKDLARSKGL